jgi:hypothetical protein
MGLLDKVKFWKKGDDFGNFNLDDFSLDKSGSGSSPVSAAPHTDPGFGGDFPSLDEPMPGMQHEAAGKMEMEPSARSQQMGEQLGLARPQQSFSPSPQFGSAQPQFQQPQQQQQYRPQPAAQDFRQGSDIAEVAKELEIIHAKIDAIRSSLDSINQRLATLERIASGDSAPRKYAW